MMINLPKKHIDLLRKYDNDTSLTAEEKENIRKELDEMIKELDLDSIFTKKETT